MPIVSAWALSLVLAAASVAFAIAAKGRFELWNQRIETKHSKANYEQGR